MFIDKSRGKQVSGHVYEDQILAFLFQKKSTTQKKGCSDF